MAENNKPSISLDSVVVQSEDQVSADMGGEVALMSIQNNYYCCLNETSGRIWKLIEQPCCIRDICSVLQSEFDVRRDECETQVLAHLTELVGGNLVDLVDGTAA